MTLELNPKGINNELYHQLGERWYTAYDDPIALLRAESKVKAPWITSRIPGTPSTVKVLDVGCGAGFLSNSMAKQGYEVSGIDISKESLDIAKAHDSTQSVSYRVGNAYELPYSASTFDVVTCMDFLEHVDQPEKVISEIARVLKPGGLFFFHTFNRNFLSYLIIIKLVEWLVKNTPPKMHVLSLFIKPSELIQYCKNAGMETFEISGIRPQFSTLTFKGIATGVVPEGFQFQLTRSTLLSYIGYAKKR